MAGERLLVTEGLAQGTVIELGDELVIGREADAPGRLADDPAISRRHARIRRDADGTLTIEDLGSTNGTWVNAQRVTKSVLRPGDRLHLGDSQLEVVAPEREPELDADTESPDREETPHSGTIVPEPPPPVAPEPPPAVPADPATAEPPVPAPEPSVAEPPVPAPEPSVAEPAPEPPPPPAAPEPAPEPAEPLAAAADEPPDGTVVPLPPEPEAPPAAEAEPDDGRERTQISTPPPVPGIERDRLRAELPVLAGVAYLDAATAGPVPRRAVDAATAALAETATVSRPPADGRIETLRRRIAGLLGGDPDEIALVPSVGAGAAAVLTGLGLRRADQVLVADDESPELLAALAAARRMLALDVRRAPLARLADAVEPATRLVVCSHVSWARGDVADLAPLAGGDVPILVDATRTVGAAALAPQLLGCDAVLVGLGAWLCGPAGLAAVRLRPDRIDEIAPSTPSTRALADRDWPEKGWRDGAARLDSGEAEQVLLAWALAALDLLDEAGWAWLAHEPVRLAGILAERLAAGGVPVEPRGESAIVAWSEADPQAVAARLADAGVTVAALPGLVRASVGAWTTEDEVERAAAAATA